MSKPREVFPGVTVDPEVSFGRPCIAGTGISCEAVGSRFMAGESVKALARDYGLRVSQVEAALRWECLSPGGRRRWLARLRDRRLP